MNTIVLKRLLLTVLVASFTANVSEAMQPATDESAVDDQVMRYDPIRRQLVPVPQDQLKVGRIYNHQSRWLGKRVWSYWSTKGEFWDAFGAGTKLPGWMLDLRVTREQGMATLQERDRSLASRLTREGGSVYFILGEDGNWTMFGRAEVPTIINAETGQRWEQHGSRYIPVRRLFK